LRTLVDLDLGRGGEPAAQHHDCWMARTGQSDRVVEERRRELPQMRHERVTENALRTRKAGEFGSVEPQATTVLAHVRIDAADPQPVQGKRRARASQLRVRHDALS
jgi:hypothetical protein